MLYISEVQKEIMYLQFTYSYKWLVDEITALRINACILYMNDTQRKYLQYKEYCTRFVQVGYVLLKNESII